MRIGKEEKVVVEPIKNPVPPLEPAPPVKQPPSPIKTQGTL